MKSVRSLLNAMLINGLTSALISFAVPAVPFIAAFTVMMLLALVVGIAGIGKSKASNMAFDGLFRELWLDQLLQDFWDNNDFLMDGENWDDLVDNDKINLAEVGIAPEVLKNNNTYPVEFAERSDTPHELALDTFDTKGTVTRKLKDKALAYNKRESIIKQHRNALLEFIADDGIYNIAPAANTANSPLIQTTGADNAELGVKIPTSYDLSRLAAAYDEKKWKGERVLNLPPAIFWVFVDSDETLKKQAQNNGSGGRGTGTWVEYYGFIIRSRNTVARYDGSLNKLAKGAVTGTAAAISYLKGESFGKGVGTAEMFARLNDPEEKGDIINFGVRAIVKPKRIATIGGLVLTPTS